jgi:hypothetical protein
VQGKRGASLEVLSLQIDVRRVPERGPEVIEATTDGLGNQPGKWRAVHFFRNSLVRSQLAAACASCSRTCVRLFPLPRSDDAAGDVLLLLSESRADRHAIASMLFLAANCISFAACAHKHVSFNWRTPAYH